MDIPKYEVAKIRDKKSKYCLCIPVINEGEKIINQLKRAQANNVGELVDIIICDGGSTDGSMEINSLKELGVSTLLTKKDKGKLSAQLRMGYAYALQNGYEGIITVDGNGKDNIEATKNFVAKLDEGYDMIQGSRFVPGGEAINTPFIRHIAVKTLHVPIVSCVAGFKYTDTTNGFRGYSKAYLEDPRVQPFRDIFQTYELLAYLSVRAPQLGYKTIEIPVSRVYPKTGKTPTKISFFKGNMDLMKILMALIKHKYDPK